MTTYLCDLPLDKQIQHAQEVIAGINNKIARLQHMHSNEKGIQYLEGCRIYWAAHLHQTLTRKNSTLPL